LQASIPVSMSFVPAIAAAANAARHMEMGDVGSETTYENDFFILLIIMKVQCNSGCPGKP
jgi:hypothetical protein